MRALLFGASVDPQPVADVDNPRLKGLATTPMDVVDLDDPTPIGPDWVVVRTRMTGICGSDAKQVFMEDAENEMDNAMTAVITFPQVLGHEVVGEVVELGPEARGLGGGQRVVPKPWLLCRPRGVGAVCPA